MLDSGRALFYQLLNLITMNISKIKSFVFGLAFFMGAMMFGGGNLQAQDELPCPPGTTNSYGGVCCQSPEDCDHPTFGLVYSSTWTRCVSAC